ncbi:MAG TPA: hypothetical protein VHZ75_00635 [Solirubrobacteraceae bacterium]|jgi:hypothetical protein|nr:hypothetical protein [Solirubrobacteraceae bacterium]
MTGQVRPKIAVLAALLSTTALAACGGSSADSAGGGDAHAAADKLIAQAIATNPAADSARISGTVDVDILGGRQPLTGATQITADGTYDLATGASVPDLDIDVGLKHADQGLGGAIVVADKTGYIRLGPTGYKIPGSITSKLIEPAEGADNGLTKTGAMFFINPQKWQTNAKLVGETKLAGVTVEHIKTDVNAKAFFQDLSRIVRLLRRLHITRALGLPNSLGPKQVSALARSVTSASGEAWIGKDDHVVRRIRAHGEMVVASKDRKLLFGIRRAKLDAALDVSEIGDVPPISAPKQVNSYSSLQLTLDALGEYVHKLIRGK